MHLDHYELKAGTNRITFEFVSEGPKGRILKVIQFTPSANKDLYNLGFGDIHAETGQMDDIAISDNGDTERVLATVVESIYVFTDMYPNAWIYATGSTKARTRLYRMGITKYLDDVLRDFDIFGQFRDQWHLFVRGTDYDAFAVKRKNRNFGL